MKRAIRILHVSIPVLIFALLVSVPFVLEAPQPTPNELNRDYLKNVVTISTPEEFDAVLKSRCVILHVDVDWSVPAAISRAVIGQLKTNVESDRSIHRVVFRRIDCSASDSEIFSCVESWLKGQSTHPSVLRVGGGAIIWVLEGRVFASDDYAAHTGLEELLARTRTAFDKE